MRSCMSPLALGLQLTAGAVPEIIGLDYTTVSANNDWHLHDVRVLISLGFNVTSHDLPTFNCQLHRQHHGQ